MQLGTPMTMLKGGINDMRRLTLKSNKAMDPKAQVTPTATTVRHTPTTAKFLKNKSNRIAVTKRAAAMK